MDYLNALQLIPFITEEGLSIRPHFYNVFFNPNICHVCKFVYNEDFHTCDRCNMISYCSVDHKRLHRSQHRKICNVIRNIRRQGLLRDTRCTTREEWFQSRKDFKRLIEQKMYRQLDVYEVQMIMYAKYCVVCYQQQNLHTCTSCYSANYCNNHAGALGRYHSTNSCHERLVYLNLIVRHPNDNFCFTYRFYSFPIKDTPVYNMRSFLEQYVSIRERTGEATVLTSRQYFYSDFVSGALTLYYGMKNTNLLEILQSHICVIHIITADSVDRNYLVSWELLLHLARTIKDLTIILIGPKLRFLNKYDTTVCSACKKRCQSISIHCYDMLYDQYVNSQLYIPPNVIVGFQVDFTDGNTSSMTYLSLRDQDCPLILTAKSKIQSDKNINKMREALCPTLLYPVFHNENDFSSFKPYRDFEDDDVYYRNKYLAIFENLRD